MEILYLGGAGALAGFAAGALFGTSGRRLYVLLAAGLGAALLLLVAAYLSATPSSEPPDCHDCVDVLGRWWEPALVVFLLMFNLVGWGVGVLVGGYGRSSLKR